MLVLSIHLSTHPYLFVVSSLCVNIYMFLLLCSLPITGMANAPNFFITLLLGSKAKSCYFKELFIQNLVKMNNVIKTFMYNMKLHVHVAWFHVISRDVQTHREHHAEVAIKQDYISYWLFNHVYSIESFITKQQIKTKYKHTCMEF